MINEMISASEATEIFFTLIAPAMGGTKNHYFTGGAPVVFPIVIYAIMT